MRKLGAIQEDFFRALRVPLPAGTHRMTSPSLSKSNLLSRRFVRGLLAGMKDGPKTSRVERLEIYHRQYWFRILDSLREDFVMTELVLGKRLHQKLTREYLVKHPSGHWTLRALGRGFPGFLRRHRGIPALQKSPAADMAALEWAMIEVFEGAAVESPMEAGSVDSATTVLRLSGSQRFVPSEYDLDKIGFSRPAAGKWRAGGLRRGECAVFCVYRAGWDVRVEKLGLAEWGCLKKFKKGSTIDNALRGVDASAQEVSEWFSKWAGRHWLEIHNEQTQRAKS